MAKRGSWYFEGYQPELKLDERGRERQVLVYRGAWYGLGLEPQAYRRCKLVCLGLSALLSAAYLLISFFPGRGGMTPWVGGPCLLALVPLMFLWIGLVNFLPAKEQWELRVLYAGYRRLGRWSAVFLTMMVITLIAEIIYMARTGPAGEWLYLLGTLVCAVCAGGLVLIWLNRPARVVRGPDVR